MRLIGLPSIAIAALVAGGAWAQNAQAAASDFPASLNQADLIAWLPAHSNLSPRDIVSVGGGRIIAVTRRGTAGVSTEARATVRTEIVTAEAAAQAGARSETQELTVDCKGRRAKAGQMWSFSQHGLRGTTKTTEGFDWTAAAAGTTLGKIVEAACRAPGTPPVPVARSDDPLAAAAFAQRPGTAPATDMAAPPPAPVAVQALPDPAPPPAAPAGEPEAPAAAPDPDPEPVAETPPPTPPPPPPPPKATATLTNLAQIGAVTSEAGAQDLLDAFKSAHPELIETRTTAIEKTVVDGQTYYRALISGFEDYAAARAFCAAVTAGGGGCVVRQR